MSASTGVFVFDLGAFFWRGLGYAWWYFMILMIILFSLWFGFYIYIYINKEVTGGLVSWVVYVLQLFVVFRLVLLTKNLGGDRNGFLFTCAVVGLAFVIEFVVRKLTSCFSRQSPAEE